MDNQYSYADNIFFRVVSKIRIFVTVAHLKPRMPIRLNLTTNGSLTFNVIDSSRLPFGVLRGLPCHHAPNSLVDVYFQECVSKHFTITNVHIKWKKEAAFIADYDYEPGIFTRVMLENDLHDSLKGAGHIHLKQDQFSLVAGSKWMSLVQAARKGNYQFLDVAWT